jgi:serine/threonine protein kinase
MSREKDPPIDGNEATLAPENLGAADTVMADSKQSPPPSPPTSTAAGSYIPGGVALSVVETSAYEISGEFARGGLGRILQAKDRRLGRPVAIKELLRSHTRATERFIREALVTARLQHPAIVPVYEAGHWPTGEPFYAMKLVNGRSLDQVIADTRNIEERLALLPVVTDVCEAIAYAHSEKIIHRDLKPANILVGSFGETVVIDWGLAKETGTTELPEELEPAEPLVEGPSTEITQDDRASTRDATLRVTHKDLKKPGPKSQGARFDWAISNTLR